MSSFCRHTSWIALTCLCACGGGPSLPSSGEVDSGAPSPVEPDTSTTDPDADPGVTSSSTGTDHGSDEESRPSDPLEECGGLKLTFDQPISRHVWLVDNSVGTLVPFDHDDDPSTPDITARERIGDFLDWMLPRYPEGDGCGSVLPSIMFYPGDMAGPPLSPDACEVTPPEWPEPEAAAALTLATWEARPEATGANAAAQALSLAANQGLGTLESSEAKRIVVLMGSPPSCGPDSESLDPGFFPLVEALVEEHDLEIMLINFGPRSGDTGAAIDGRPDDVDLQDYWAGLGQHSQKYNLPVDGTHVLNWIEQSTPTFQTGCLLEPFGQALPTPAQLTPMLTINGTPYYELDIEYWQCNSPDTPTGFTWADDVGYLRLCGEACDAIRCEERPAFPDNGLVIEVPYLCED